MSAKKLLRNGPFIAFLSLIFLVWPAKLVLYQIEATFAINVDKPLVGKFIRPTLPNSLLAGIWLHEFQDWAETKVSDVFPLRGRTVRLVNQAYYALFSKSYMGGRHKLVVANHRNLFSESYLRAYCNTGNDVPPPAEFHAWAERIHNVQRWFESRGRTFFYFLSPSKAAYYSDDIPWGFGCPVKFERPRYTRAITALKERGIPLVDSSLLMKRKQGPSELEMFPIGGIHYTAPAAAIVANALTAEITKLRGISIPAIPTRYKAAPTPSANDRDLTDLLNVAVPFLDYPTPELLWGGYLMEHPLPLTVAFAGGSFVGQPARLMGLYKLFDHVFHYYYFKIVKISYPGDELSEIPDYSAFDQLFAADVIILEENEEIAMSTHGLAFLDEAERRMELSTPDAVANPSH